MTDTGPVDLVDLVGIGLLTELQSTFIEATGRPSIIASVGEKAKGVWLTEPSMCSNLCKAIRQTESGKRSCLRSDLAHAREATEKGKVIKYECTCCGLIDCCAPIYVGGTPVAAIFGGQFLLSTDDKKRRRQVERRAAKYIGETRAKTLLQEIPTLNAREVPRLLAIARAMAKAISELATERYRSRLLQSLTISASKARTVKELLDLILDTSKRAIPGVSSGSISLRSSDKGAFVPVAWSSKVPMGEFAFTSGEGFIGRVIKHRKPVLENRVGPEARVAARYPEIVRRRNIASILAIPLIAYPQERLVGVLELSSARENAFNKEQETLLMAAGQVAAALIQRTLEWECTSTLASSRDADEMLHKAVRIVPELFDGLACSIFMLEPRSGEFVLRASDGLPRELLGYGKSLRVPAGKKARGKTSLKRIHPALEWSHRFRERTSRKHHKRMVDRPFLAAPIKTSSGTTVGVLRISDRIGPGDFADDNAKILERVCAHIGSSLEIMENHRRLQETLLHERLNTVVLCAAGLAHEIMSPLTGVIYALDNLQGAVHNKLTSALAECRRIDGSVSRLLSFADAPPDDVWVGADEQATVDLVELVDEGLGIVKYQFEVRSVMTERRIASRPVNVIGDHYSLQLVVLNLLVNAYEAMEDARGPRVLTVTVHKRENRGILRVTNRGRTIPKDRWQKVFTPDISSKGASGRRGMGLAICRRIVVDVHAGDIGVVRSTRRDGTTFEVALPLRPPESKGPK